MRWKIAPLLLILGSLVVLYCGNQKRPPGGPPDVTPPEITDVIPFDQEEAVPLDSEIVIFFSEIVEKGSVEKAVKIVPKTVLDTDWDGDMLKLRPRQGFDPQTTYDLYLAGEVRDRDNNRATFDIHHVFTTADSLPPGSISGQATHLKQDLEYTKVELYSLELSHLDSIPPLPVRLATTGKQGHFTFEFVPEGVYQIRAYIDNNRDWKWQQTTEPAALAERPIYIVKNVPKQADFYLNMMLPDDPGAIFGQISRPDTLQAYPVILQAIRTNDEPDTLRYQHRTGSDDEYAWYDVPAGSYLLSAFIDVKRDSAGADSIDYQLAYPDTIRVESGLATEGIHLDFAPKADEPQ